MTRERQRITLHHVKGVPSGQMIEQTGGRFDVENYSRFKYGDGEVAKQYGYGLAARLLIEHPEMVLGEAGIAILSAPYVVIPTASYAISVALQDALNAERAKLGLEPAVNVQIVKGEVGSVDYPSYTQAEREKALQELSVIVDEQLLKGRHILVVDDVFITGTTEANTARLIEPLEKLSVWYLYAVQMDTEQAALDPSIESRINSAWVTNLQRLAQVIDAEHYLLNVRACKFILGWSNEEELRGFFEQRSTEFLLQMYKGIVLTGQAFIDRYPESFELLKTLLETRGIKGKTTESNVPREI